jgi:hypothetical protein
MRRLTIRLAAVALLALAASQLHVGSAQACIKFDRAAEMVLIEQAIASPATSEANRTELKALRSEILDLRKKAETESEAIYLHGRVTTKALALLGKERVVWNGPPELDVGVFKKTKSTKGAQRTADAPAAGAVPACG